MRTNAMLTIVALAVMAAPLFAQTDQTVPVQRGTRLDFNNFAGEVVIRTWDKDAVRVEAAHSDRERVDINNSASVLTLRSHSRLGPPRSMDFQITAPVWMRLDVSGTYLDVTIEGTQGEVMVETVRGDITVRGGSGFVSLKSVEGFVTLEKAKGRVTVSSVNEGIRLADVAGEISAETVNGAITLERLEPVNLDAATVNGDVAYTGTIKNDGRYRLGTHNGDITVTIPENTNATVSARTYNGSLRSSFPMTQAEPPQDASMPRRSGSASRRVTFTIGTGSARLELESFGGAINVRKPGATAK